MKCSPLTSPSSGLGGAAKIATGEGQATVTGGAFSGVVSVAVVGNYSLQSLQTYHHQPGWQCDLFLVNSDGSEFFANGTGSPAWAKAASVDTLNSAIGGDFPPASPADIKNLDPVTGAYK